MQRTALPVRALGDNHIALRKRNECMDEALKSEAGAKGSFETFAMSHPTLDNRTPYFQTPNISSQRVIKCTQLVSNIILEDSCIRLPKYTR